LASNRRYFISLNDVALVCISLKNTFVLKIVDIRRHGCHNNIFFIILKGLSHQVGKACKWFHWIDLKFKGLRIMFIFNLYGILTMNFLKMEPIYARFSPGFLSEAVFHGEEFTPAWF
jgi:hypothetical protein